MIYEENNKMCDESISDRSHIKNEDLLNDHIMCKIKIEPIDLKDENDVQEEVSNYEHNDLKEPNIWLPLKKSIQDEIKIEDDSDYNLKNGKDDTLIERTKGHHKMGDEDVSQQFLIKNEDNLISNIIIKTEPIDLMNGNEIKEEINDYDYTVLKKGNERDVTVIEQTKGDHRVNDETPEERKLRKNRERQKRFRDRQRQNQESLLVMCKRRECETIEQIEKQRLQNAERKRRSRAAQRANETEEQAMARRARIAEQARQSRAAQYANESEEEATARRARLAEKVRQLRAIKQANESDEQAMARRARAAEKVRQLRAARRANESEEQTAARRARMAENVCQLRATQQANESDEQAMVRRARAAEKVRQLRAARRANESEEQTAARRARMAENVRQLRATQQANESEKQAMARRARLAQKVRQLRTEQKELRKPTTSHITSLSSTHIYLLPNSTLKHENSQSFFTGYV